MKTNPNLPEIPLPDSADPANSVCRPPQIRLSSRVSKFWRVIKNWWLVAVWMAVIFTASADGNSYRHSSLYFEPLMRWLFPHLAQDRIETLHHIFRKGCHLTEYAILALLCRHAIRRSLETVRTRWRWDEAGLALAIVFTYAASDELHQVFVPMRTGQVSDVLVDVCGGVLGLTLLWLVQKLFRPAEK